MDKETFKTQYNMLVSQVKRLGEKSIKDISGIETDIMDIENTVIRMKNILENK